MNKEEIELKLTIYNNLLAEKKLFSCEKELVLVDK